MLEVEAARITWELAYQQYQGIRDKKKRSEADIRHVELWRWWRFVEKLEAHAEYAEWVVRGPSRDTW